MTAPTPEQTASITYCRGHGWQLLAGVELPLDEIRECGSCKVVQR